MQISFQELKGVSRLFSDYLYSFPSLADFYNGDYRQGESYRKIVSAISGNTYPRQRLAEILLSQNKSFGASQKTLENIALLADKNTFTIFTGQQVGLFGGPLYTVYKSLAAVKLAEKLSKDLSVKVIPIFWMAADDHDWAEINHVFLINQAGELIRLDYQPEKDWSGYPASGVILDSGIKKTINDYQTLLPAGKYKEEAFNHLSTFYRPGQSYTSAFASLLTHLLGKFGLIILDPADPAFKKELAPLFIREIEKNGRLQGLIESASQRLESLHYHRQVHKKEGLTNLFYHSPHRVQIKKENGSFALADGKQKFTPSELTATLHKSPQDFSANVLLRPVLESFAFPNIAHVAGPSEIAYFAQVKDLHTELGVEMPVLFPRASLTLLEPEVKSILSRYQISAAEVIKDFEQAYNRVIEKKIPSQAQKLLDQTQSELKNMVLKLGEEILKLQPGLKPNLEFTAGKIDFEFNKFREKLFQAYKKEFSQVKEELRRASIYLNPQGNLQERSFNAVYFLSRYGENFIDLLHRAIDLDKSDHRIVEVE